MSLKTGTSEEYYIQPNGEQVYVQNITPLSHTHGDGNGEILYNADDAQKEEDETPVVDIVINNVVCTFGTRCHLNLKQIAMDGCNVIYRRENGMVSMKIRKPYTTSSIWSSGKITCTGATSEEDALTAARRHARCLQNMGYKVRFSNFRVVNVLGTCTFNFGIRINLFSRAHSQHASYEPELHPGVTYRIPHIKATLKIFSTGSVTVTAPRVANVQAAIEHIYPLVLEFSMQDKRKELSEGEIQNINSFIRSSAEKKMAFKRSKTVRPVRQGQLESDDEESFGSDPSGNESDSSQE